MICGSTLIRYSCRSNEFSEPTASSRSCWSASRSATSHMNQSAMIWDRIAKRYSKKPVADEAAYQKKLQVTRGYFRSDI